MRRMHAQSPASWTICRGQSRQTIASQGQFHIRRSTGATYCAVWSFFALLVGCLRNVTPSRAGGNLRQHPAAALRSGLCHAAAAAAAAASRRAVLRGHCSTAALHELRLEAPGPAAGCPQRAARPRHTKARFAGCKRLASLLASRQPVPQEFMRSLLPSHAVSCRLWHLGKALDGEATQKQRSGDELAAEQEQAGRADGHGDAGASERDEHGSAAGPRRQTYHVIMTSGGERCAPERCRKRCLLLRSQGTVLGLPQHAFLSHNLPRSAVLAHSCEARPWSPGCPYFHS